ncbi:MAG: hypothetical protein ACM3MK_12785, partial [Chitinophagales bacterium]
MLNILLIEGDERSRLQLAGYLRMLGHVVTTCSEWQKGLEIISGQNYQMVLVETNLSQMTATEIIN